MPWLRRLTCEASTRILLHETCAGRPCLESALEDAMDGNNATSMDKSEKERQDEVWVTTHSATRAFVAVRDKGSEVVGAVSSEMAIPYLAKTPQGRTMVPRAAAKSNARHDGGSAFAEAWLAGWRCSSFKGEDKFDGSNVDCKPCPR